MTEGVKTIIYPVRDPAQAKPLYARLLGVEPGMDEAYYVGFNVEGQDIGLDPNGHSQGMTGPSATGTSTTSKSAFRRSSTPERRCSKRSGTWAVVSSSLPSRTRMATSSASSTSNRGLRIGDTGLSGPTYQLRPVGWVDSPLADRAAAPKQGDEGAPLARIVFLPEFSEAVRDLHEGEEVLVLTWLHQGRRDVLSVHPRGEANRPRTGVFATRSPDRPNPIGLHAVTIETVEKNAITVHNLEAIDGTPVLDIKPILGGVSQR